MRLYDALMLVDAHLDLAWNATQRGRDVTRPAADQPFVDNETATVGLPDLRRGGVGLVCGTLFALPADHRHAGYEDAAGARRQVEEQLAWYESAERAGELKIVRSARDVPERAGHAIGCVILMEGAEPIERPEDVADWFGRGVRMVGLAWGKTAHAGGTRSPGGLTPLGRATVAALDAAGVIHDASHLAEAAVDELLDLAAGPVCATHSNCRAIVGDDPGGRHLPDRQIKAICARGGMIGLNFYDKFLLPAGRQPPATLADVAAHARRIADLAGRAEAVGIGTDMDGGLGREHIPRELRTAADLPKLADALLAAGFTDAEAAGVLGGHWQRWLRANLPA